MHGTLLSIRQWASQELMGTIRGDTNKDICYKSSGRDKVVDKTFFKQSEETSGSWPLVLMKDLNLHVGKATCNTTSNSRGFWSALGSIFLMQVLD